MAVAPASVAAAPSSAIKAWPSVAVRQPWWRCHQAPPINGGAPCLGGGSAIKPASSPALPLPADRQQPAFALDCQPIATATRASWPRLASAATFTCCSRPAGECGPTFTCRRAPRSGQRCHLHLPQPTITCCSRPAGKCGPTFTCRQAPRSGQRCHLHLPQPTITCRTPHSPGPSWRPAPCVQSAAPCVPGLQHPRPLRAERCPLRAGPAAPPPLACRALPLACRLPLAAVTGASCS